MPDTRFIIIKIMLSISILTVYFLQSKKKKQITAVLFFFLTLSWIWFPFTNKSYLKEAYWQ